MPDSSHAELSALLLWCGLELQRLNNILKQVASAPRPPDSAEQSLAHAMIKLVEDRRAGR